MVRAHLSVLPDVDLGIDYQHDFLSIRFFDEDEGRPGYDRRACSHERDVDVLNLAFTGAPRGLQRALYDMPEAVDAPGAEAPAERVERQLAVELDTPALDEIERLAFLAEPV